jgi:hypothetical protein
MEHPIFSVREELVPQALVSVKVFEASTSGEVEALINSWIVETQNLVVCPGPVSSASGKSIVAITYVEANKNNDPEKEREVGKTPRLDAQPSGGVSNFESDGGRIA